MTLNIVLVVLYLAITAFLGWLGYRKTHSAADYMLAGRRAHPFIMAMSYGATFISTSAIVGFGGVAAQFGMSLLWLTFLNIFVGIFIAFVFLGGATRRMGHRLDAHTFPELLGRRYDSKFIQVFVGAIIFLFMPLYAAAVMIGGTVFLVKQFNIPDAHFMTALIGFAVLVALYVLTGGLKSVMYTDAFQGVIMVAGMVVLLVYTYNQVGGVTAGHEKLTDLAPLAPQALQNIGHRGWTAMPEFGFGAPKYNLWWIVVSSITLGVGIGVLAQPQLAVRFMTVKSQRELNRAVIYGGLFILLIPGTAYVVGSLSNVYFAQSGKVFTGEVIKSLDAKGEFAVIRLMKDGKLVLDAKTGKPANPLNVKVVSIVTPTTRPEGGVAAGAIVTGRSHALANAGGVTDEIIPIYIKSAMPHWFGVVFLLTLLAAAMSTMSSQFHTLGTALGRDVVQQVSGARSGSVAITKGGMVVGIVLAVLFSFYARGGERGDYIISRATAVFFGLCAATFLPAFVGGLFFRRMTKAAAVASIIAGASASLFWLMFVKQKEAGDIGLVQMIMGADAKSQPIRSILYKYPNWPEVDPVLIALPVSIVVAIVVSLLTQPPTDEHLAKCFD